MKKAISLFAGFFFLLVSFSAKAQNPTVDYFAGKWNVLIKGTPQGDAKLVFVLEKNAGSLTGSVQDSTGAVQSKIEKVDIGTDNNITIYCNLSGYDLSIELKKKDEDKATGSLMSMFDVEADRIKTPKQLK